jgi:sucrose-6-phosphate hydrolase SacC (GH32 family)
LAAPDLRVPPSRFAGDRARPRFHALPAAGWTNEPHGLIHDGERFRLFYQANPNGPFWARIRWGQLTSPDLVHWTQRPPALVPEPGFDQAGIWVGNTFFDEEGRLRAAYTGVNGVKAGIGLAGAGDGFQLAKSPGNPVLADAPAGFKDFRDPFVWRDDDGWAMLVGSGTVPPAERGVALLYRSSNLRDWRYDGILDVGDATPAGIYWEVPVLQPLADGRHALMVTTVEAKTLARGLYWLGRWDGAAFVPETQRPRTLDVFHRMLSPTLARHPDGRLVAIGIVPGTQRPAVRNARGWVHSFSLPRELRPCERAGLCQRPLAELAELRGARHDVEERVLGDEPTTLDLGDVAGDQMELVLDLDPGAAEEIVLHLRTTPDRRERSTIRFWPDAGVAGLDLSRASLTEDLGRARFDGRLTPLTDGERLRLRVFVDHSVVDVFVNDTDAFSFRTFASRADATGVELEAHGGDATLRSATAWALVPAPIR